MTGKVVASWIVLLVFAGFAFASGDHGETGTTPAMVGPDKAITAFSAEDGFKMSDRALQALKVQFGQVSGDGPWTISSDSLIRLKHSTGVYRRYEGWVSFVVVNVLRKDGPKYIVTSPDLQAGDEIATAGTTFLRMTELDITSDTVDSCSH